MVKQKKPKKGEGIPPVDMLTAQSEFRSSLQHLIFVTNSARDGLLNDRSCRPVLLELQKDLRETADVISNTRSSIPHNCKDENVAHVSNYVTNTLHEARNHGCWHSD